MNNSHAKMDEEEEQVNPTTEPGSSTGSRGRGRGRRRRAGHLGLEEKRHSARTPKWVAKFQCDDTWTLTEKRRLLEALRRYDPHNLKNITRLVGTKTEEEVEKKIQSLRGVDSARGKSSRGEAVPGQEIAPIEAWIDLVQEMTFYEPADYSQFIPKVLGLIARNEMFEESGIHRLRWRNIYQFLSDLAEERVELEQLSDVECLVILDLMHNLGDTLYRSDTSEQRRILDFKYNLLNFKSDNPNKAEKEINNQRILQALSNDFWDPDDLPGKSATVSSGSSSTSSTTTLSSSVSSTLTHRQGDVLPSAGSSLQTDSNTITMTCGRMTDSAVPSTSGSTDHVIPGPSYDLTNHTNPSTSSPDDQVNLACSSRQPRTLSLSINEGTGDQNSDSEDEEEERASSDISLQTSAVPRKKLDRPLYFTLNPLCVPTQLLAFKRKSQDT